MKLNTENEPVGKDEAIIKLREMRERLARNETIPDDPNQIDLDVDFDPVVNKLKPITESDVEKVNKRYPDTF